MKGKNHKNCHLSLNFTLTMTFILRYISPHCQDKQKKLPTTTKRLIPKYYPGKMGGKGKCLLEWFLVGRHLPQANQGEVCSLFLDTDSKLNFSPSTPHRLKCLHKTKHIFSPSSLFLVVLLSLCNLRKEEIKVHGTVLIRKNGLCLPLPVNHLIRKNK